MNEYLRFALFIEWNDLDAIASGYRVAVLLHWMFLLIAASSFGLIIYSIS